MAFAKRARADQLSMSAAEFDAASREARSKAEARRAREVRRGMGSTAAARRIGGFSPGSGPGGGGDFDVEEAAGDEADAAALPVASMSVSSWAVSFAGLSPRAAAATLGGARGTPRGGGGGGGSGGGGNVNGDGTVDAAFSDDDDDAEDKSEASESALPVAVAETAVSAEAAATVASVATAAAAAETAAAATAAAIAAVADESAAALAPPPLGNGTLASHAATDIAAAPEARLSALDRALGRVASDVASAARDNGGGDGFAGELAGVAELVRKLDRVLEALER